MRIGPCRILVLALVFVGLACTQTKAPRPPRNPDESKVGAYVLPELLVTKDGRRVTTPALWREVRRGELLADFATSTYGRTPTLPFRVRAQTLATRRDAVDG